MEAESNLASINYVAAVISRSQTDFLSSRDKKSNFTAHSHVDLSSFREKSAFCVLKITAYLLTWKNKKLCVPSDRGVIMESRKVSG